MVIARKTVLCLGSAQLVSWGTSYYLIGGFGKLIAADLHWRTDVVYGGFSAALLMMGLISPLTGRLIDHHGGQRVMIAGSMFNAVGCWVIAVSRDAPAYYAAWICLGVGMRLTLYDAAFATLARIGGPEARGPMSQITLLGGLASTVFWPLGHLLANRYGWRNALFVYAGLALLTIPLFMTVPKDRYGELPLRETHNGVRPIALNRQEVILAGSLFAVIATLTNFLNAGMSAHMIDILTGLGLIASAAVWISALRGIGQVSSRLCEILLGRKVDPLRLNLLGCAVLPLCFLVGLFSGQTEIAALTFAFFYGAGNGVVTITRGTVPLELFEHGHYGAFAGKLIAPSFIASAASPVIFASIIGRFGETSALILSICIASITFAAAVFLKTRFMQPRGF